MDIEAVKCILPASHAKQEHRPPGRSNLILLALADRFVHAYADSPGYLHGYVCQPV